MKEELLKIKDEAKALIEKAEDLKSLEDLRVKFLGKKGDLTAILKMMGSLSAEERPVMGQLANEVREDIEVLLKNKFDDLNALEREKRLDEETLDISIDKDLVSLGHEHPLIKVKEKLEDLFMRMGFKVIEGPEIETVENNFDLLNAPQDHPSRDMSDTFYIDKENLLRTQTSPVQIRAMKKYGAPLKMVSCGRTFRFDDVDNTHSPMFYQMEGLVVGENISLANLKFTIDQFVRELLGEKIQTRYRPHHFPFTEPSMEVDVTCHKCGGEGCEFCGGTGWSMELLGCGMVHPNVLRNCGIDPKKYSGFAFGFGVDRITMVSYGINDIRLLYENDQRFLDEF